MLVGVAAVVGLVLYLVWQQTQPAGDDLSEWAEVEADPAPDLPGEFVDLQTIYDGAYDRGGGSATASHVTRDVDYETEQGLPPAGGPHWGSTGCGDDPNASPPFCGPARWGIYLDPWEPETLVHNMEHGGVIVWHNTTDQAVLDDLMDLVRDHLEDDQLIVMAPFPAMDDEHIAVTSWARRDLFPVEDYTRERVDEYIDEHERRFNPEGF